MMVGKRGRERTPALWAGGDEFYVELSFRALLRTNA
jgi:hypothetical protein